MAINISDATSAIKLELTVQYGKYEPEVYFLDKTITNVSYDEDLNILKLSNLKYEEFRIAFADVTSPVEADIAALANTIQGYKNTAGPAAPLPAGAATEAKQTQPGVDIGDVTVNNAAGAAAVNIQDGGNSITIDAASLPLPTGAATEATVNDIKTAVQIMDDWDESDRAKVNTIVGQVGVAANSGVANASTQRVVLATDVALPAGTNNIGDVDILSLVPGTAATNLGKAEDSGHTTGDTGVMLLAVRNDTNASLSGTDLDYTPISVDANGSVHTSGDIAHDAVDAGNPGKVGYKAIAHGANPVAVADNDRTHGYANRHGIPWVIGGHPNIITVRANFTAAQTDTSLVTVGAGNKIVVTRASVISDNATTVDVAARIGFGAATTPTTTGVILSSPGINNGSGVIEGNGSGILGIGADGEDLRITSEVATTGSIDCVISYYTIES